MTNKPKSNKMNLIIKENGESNIKSIVHINTNGKSYIYKGEDAKELIRLMHKAILGEDI